MKIDSVDFFYLAMTEVTTEADGSQDALLVRVVVGGHVGWGECDRVRAHSRKAQLRPFAV
jgi:hypothetical protein